jgi:hypothetical protein
MKGYARVAIVSVVALVVLLQSSLSAKLPTVKVIVAGPGLAGDVPLVEKSLLVNVWTGFRSSEGWLDFPQPFIGAIVPAPPPEWPRYLVSFVAQWTPEQQRVVYRVRYVPDPQRGGGYIYLPGPNEPDGRLNQSTIIRSQDGSWLRASAEFGEALNAHLPHQTTH